MEEDDTEKNSEHSVKEEMMVTEDSQKDTEVVLKSPLVESEDANTEVNFESFDHQNNGITMAADLTTFFPDFKDGSSDDSDSSAILNEDNNSPKAAISSYAATTNGVPIRSHQFMPSSMNCFPFSSTSSKPFLEDAQKACYQPQFVKIEEHNFLSGDESCNFFSDDRSLFSELKFMELSF